MRQRLPDRRHQITRVLAWAPAEGRWETRVFVSAGIDPATLAIREVFLRGAGKIGSERDFLFDDIAVCVARSLQHGDNLKALAAGMGRSPEGNAMSLLGAVIDLLVEIEGELQAPDDPGNVVPFGARD